MKFHSPNNREGNQDGDALHLATRRLRVQDGLQNQCVHPEGVDQQSNQRANQQNGTAEWGHREGRLFSERQFPT